MLLSYHMGRKSYQFHSRNDGIEYKADEDGSILNFRPRSIILADGDKPFRRRPFSIEMKYRFVRVWRDAIPLFHCSLYLLSSIFHFGRHP